MNNCAVSYYIEKEKEERNEDKRWKMEQRNVDAMKAALETEEWVHRNLKNQSVIQSVRETSVI
jgi:hypothetical protein